MLEKHVRGLPLAGVNGAGEAGVETATRRLMELFYEGVWTRGEPAVAALWRAKRILREEGAPVRDWAAWVLGGDPGGIDPSGGR